MADQSTTPQPNSDDETQSPVEVPESEAELEELLVRVSEKFTGPIPPPSIMKQYEEILPGSADRILKMAENQSEHRQSLEKQRLSFSNRAVRRGQIFGLVIGIVAIVTGGYTALNGAPIPGGFIGTTGVVGLVAVFVIGSNRKPPQG